MNLTPENLATGPLFVLVLLGGACLVFSMLFMALRRREWRWLIPALLLFALWLWSSFTLNTTVHQESKDSVVSALVTASEDKYGVELTDEEARTLLGDAPGPDFGNPELFFERGHKSETVSVDVDGEARDVALIWDGKSWLLAFPQQEWQELPLP